MRAYVTNVPPLNKDALDLVGACVCHNCPPLKKDASDLVGACVCHNCPLPPPKKDYLIIQLIDYLII